MTIDKPRPVPWTLRSLSTFTLKKRSVNLNKCFFAMPSPVSVTVKQAKLLEFLAQQILIIECSGEYLMALLTRF